VAPAIAANAAAKINPEAVSLSMALLCPPWRVGVDQPENALRYTGNSECHQREDCNSELLELQALVSMKDKAVVK
jgi:hypothetical protein